MLRIKSVFSTAIFYSLYFIPSWALAECKLNGQVVPCDQIKGSAMAVLGVTGLILLLAVGLSAHWIWMLVHCLTKEVDNKLIWVLLMIFTGFIGSLLYAFIEKKKYDAARKGL